MHSESQTIAESVHRDRRAFDPMSWSTCHSGDNRGWRGCMHAGAEVLQRGANPLQCTKGQNLADRARDRRDFVGAEAQYGNGPVMTCVDSGRRSADRRLGSKKHRRNHGRRKSLCIMQARRITLTKVGKAPSSFRPRQTEAEADAVLIPKHLHNRTLRSGGEPQFGARPDVDIA